jgi:hypothetical protein
MIYLSLNLSNPWSRKWQIVKSLSRQLTRNTYAEFNIYRTGNILGLEVNWTLRQDHAGVRLQLGLVGWEVEMHVYDIRHWNSTTENWETYD